MTNHCRLKFIKMKYVLIAVVVAISVFGKKVKLINELNLMSVSLFLAVSAANEKDPDVFNRWTSEDFTNFVIEKANGLPKVVFDIMGKIKVPKENPFNSDKWTPETFGKLMMDNLKNAGDAAKSAFVKAANEYEQTHEVGKKEDD